ncbi:MAG: hydrogenase maturation nickel metallochaperone HypA [Synechococcaceae cyanobacterium SM2_3_1]|nr:hydrogenase maturation nickel metallochaperone HypA [Synechococcaceae cyanobacterium SM2_3_1]
MHETDMTRALIQTLQIWWQAQPESPRIERVYLQVGQFTCVEPASLQFAYRVQTRNTVLEGSQLLIEEIPLVAFCQPCQQTYRPEIGTAYACPTCHAPMQEIRSGRELKIAAIDHRSTLTPMEI